MPARTAFLIAASIAMFGLSGCNRQSDPASTPVPISDDVRGDRLAPCPDTPNCVSSQAENQAHYLAPIPGPDGQDSTMVRLRSIIEASPRVKIVEASAGYLRAEYTIPVFGFVDDVEFLWSEEGNVLHVRSASRTGRRDLGVNRRRVERIRKAMAGSDPARP